MSSGSSTGRAPDSKSGNTGSYPVPSAIDKVNTRRLISHIKKKVYDITNSFAGEVNDTITRNHVQDLASSYLNELQSRHGLNCFQVICDETNNTPHTVNLGQLNLSINIGPTHALDYISLDFNVFGKGINDIIGLLVDIEAIPIEFVRGNVSIKDMHNHTCARVAGIVGLDGGFVCNPAIPGVDPYYVIGCRNLSYYLLYNGDKQFAVYLTECEHDVYELTTGDREIIDGVIEDYVKEMMEQR